MKTNMSRYAIVLAAGKGTRMKADLPKVLVELHGRPLLLHVLDSTVAAGLKHVVIVVGYQHERVEAAVQDWLASNQGVHVSFALQAEQNGTGHAVLCAREAAAAGAEAVVILLGDVPLIKPQTIQEAMQLLHDKEASSVVISMAVPDPTGYGRILRNADGLVEGIVEEKDATEEQKNISEVNSGIFVFRDSEMWSALEDMGNENAQHEYYLTDTVHILSSRGKRVLAWRCPDAAQLTGINSREQLQELEALI